MAVERASPLCYIEAENRLYVENTKRAFLSFPISCFSFYEEGSHSGLVRPPAKRLLGETRVMGSNPIPSAIKSRNVWFCQRDEGQLLQTIQEYKCRLTISGQ